MLPFLTFFNRVCVILRAVSKLYFASSLWILHPHPVLQRRSFFVTPWQTLNQIVDDLHLAPGLLRTHKLIRMLIFDQIKITCLFCQCHRISRSLSSGYCQIWSRSAAVRFFQWWARILALWTGTPLRAHWGYIKTWTKVKLRFFSMRPFRFLTVYLTISSYHFMAYLVSLYVFMLEHCVFKERSIAAGIPVISISLGSSARFLYQRSDDSSGPRSALLRSGDIFIFGNEARLLKHGVLKIFPKTCPKKLTTAMEMEHGEAIGRLNLTFRQT